VHISAVVDTIIARNENNIATKDKIDAEAASCEVALAIVKLAFEGPIVLKDFAAYLRRHWLRWNWGFRSRQGFRPLEIYDMALSQSEEVTQKKHSCLSVKTLSGIGAEFEKFCSQVAAAATWRLQTERESGGRAPKERGTPKDTPVARIYTETRANDFGIRRAIRF
jgi:hypothetical protein